MQMVTWNQTQGTAQGALRRGARTMLTEFFATARAELLFDPRWGPSSTGDPQARYMWPSRTTWVSLTAQQCAERNLLAGTRVEVQVNGGIDPDGNTMAHQLTYAQMPLYYTWVKSGRHALTWRRRQSRPPRNTIARIYSGVTPSCAHSIS